MLAAMVCALSVLGLPASPLTRADLASVHGDERSAAIGAYRAGTAQGANYADTAFNGLRTSDQTRELFDNWHAQIVVLLIQAAMSERR